VKRSKGFSLFAGYSYFRVLDFQKSQVLSAVLIVISEDKSFDDIVMVSQELNTEVAGDVRRRKSVEDILYRRPVLEIHTIAVRVYVAQEQAPFSDRDIVARVYISAVISSRVLREFVCR